MSKSRQLEIEKLKKELADLEAAEIKEIEDLKAKIAKKKKSNSFETNSTKKIDEGYTINKYYDETQFDNPMYKIANNKLEDYYIVADNITKSYGKKQVLKGISIKIKKGERIAIIGPNGAGKSTFIEIVAGVKQPTSGDIKFAFGKNKIDRAAHLGMQFQETSYPTKIKVKDIIKLVMTIQKVKIDENEFNKMIDLFNIREIYENKADGLSGGQKQRLNVFLSVIHKPQFLILDEIGAGLDTRSWAFIKRYLMAYIQKYNVTSIAVSHNTDEVMAFASRIIVINEGKIYEDRMLQDIIRQYGTFAKYVDDLFVKKLGSSEMFQYSFEGGEK